MRLAVSHTYLYKKLDEFGKDHLHEIKEQIEKEGFTLSPEYSDGIIKEKDTGRKLVIDNFNYTSEPHDMTAENQNKVINWVGLMITENRITGAGMDDEKPSIEKVTSLENGLFLPNSTEHNQQRSDYISLCGRIAVNNMECLKSLTDVVTYHIKHKYSGKTSQPTNSVSVTIMFTLSCLVIQMKKDLQ